MDRESRKRIRYQKALQFAECLKKGMTLEQIGNEYGYTREYVRQILLNELGIKSNRKQYKIFSKDIQEQALKQLVEEYNEKINKLYKEKEKYRLYYLNLRKYYKNKED